MQAGMEKVSRKVQGQMEVLREHAERLRQVEEEVGAIQVHHGQLELIATPSSLSCTVYL